MVLYFIRSEIHFIMLLGMLLVGAMFNIPFFMFLGFFYKQYLDETKLNNFKLTEKFTSWNNILCHVPNQDTSKVVTCKSGCCSYMLPTSTEDEDG